MGKENTRRRGGGGREPLVQADNCYVMRNKQHAAPLRVCVGDILTGPSEVNYVPLAAFHPADAAGSCNHTPVATSLLPGAPLLLLDAGKLLLSNPMDFALRFWCNLACFHQIRPHQQFVQQCHQQTSPIPPSSPWHGGRGLCGLLDLNASSWAGAVIEGVFLVPSHHAGQDSSHHHERSDVPSCPELPLEGGSPVFSHA